jgi:hypothetical protein
MAVEMRGGFSPEEIKTLKEAYDQIEVNLSKKLDNQHEELTKKHAKVITSNQDAIDSLIAGANRIGISKGTKTFGEAFSQAIQEKESELMNFGKNRDQRITLDLKGLQWKTVGDMSTSASLTGDPHQSYGQRQGLIPSQKVNIRDLIPTAYSATGQYVTYRESAGEGVPTQQTEGSAKAQLDFDFSEVKTVNKYLSGFTRFTKQLMHNLPWLQTTLSRALLREFYKKENSLFYTSLSTNSEAATTSGGNIAEKIIDMIAEQGGNDFNSDFILIDHAGWASLMKTSVPTVGTSYSIPGGVVFDQNGVARVAGVPVIPASFVTADDIQIVDTSYIERVEVESLRVEFSYEDANNFTENKVTARIECLEELNLLRTDAHLNYGTAS